MLERLTKLHWLLIFVIAFCLFAETKEYFCGNNGITSKCEKEIKNKVFGVRGKNKFKNFTFQINKKCNLLGQSDCTTNRYCEYKDKCTVKSDEAILQIFNNELDSNINFKLSGY